jgi:hypothetical protein
LGSIFFEPFIQLEKCGQYLSREVTMAVDQEAPVVENDY